MRHRFAPLVAAGAFATLLTACSEDDRIAVDVVLTKPLTATEVWLKKTIDNHPSDPWSRGVSVHEDTRVGRVEITHPKDANRLVLLGRVHLDSNSNTIAEGTLTIEPLSMPSATPYKLELHPCAETQLQPPESDCRSSAQTGSGGAGGGMPTPPSPSCVHSFGQSAPAPAVPVDLDSLEPDCSKYCSQLDAFCREVPQASLGSQSRCLAICNQVHGSTDPSDTQVDSLTCRISQLSLAAQFGNQRATYCANASYLNPGVCGEPCRAYCRIGVALCPDHFGYDAAECAVRCNAITGTPERAKMLLGCRFGQLTNAALDRSYCADAALDTDCPTCPRLPAP